jgi:hypothetical protein
MVYLIFSYSELRLNMCQKKNYITPLPSGQWSYGMWRTPNIEGGKFGKVKAMTAIDQIAIDEPVDS